MHDVAALFVDPYGIYPALNRQFGGIDCWGPDRDARQYTGPYPVVAHPPCQLWGNLASLNFARYGGEHNRPGNDGGCFASALQAVRTFGGVLEHPAGSRAFAAYGLSKPIGIGWIQDNDGWVCEVWQSAYGHKARKRTWLYYCGAQAPAELSWDRQAGTHQIGWWSNRAKPTLEGRKASETPEEFAVALLSLARGARKPI